MGRYAVLLLALALCGGCASRQGSATACRPVYLDAPAPAIVFETPYAINHPPVFLPREPRQPAAFVGFEELTATFFYIRTDDQQWDPWHGGLHRQAISERVGVSYR